MDVIAEGSIHHPDQAKENSRPSVRGLVGVITRPLKKIAERLQAFKIEKKKNSKKEHKQAVKRNHPVMKEYLTIKSSVIYCKSETTANVGNHTKLVAGVVGSLWSGVRSGFESSSALVSAPTQEKLMMVGELYENRTIAAEKANPDIKVKLETIDFKSGP